MRSTVEAEAFDVFEFDVKTFNKGKWLSRVVQYPDGRIRVAGRSGMADDIRRRAGTEFGESASALLSGMTLYLIEDATAAEFVDGPPAPGSMLGIDDLLLAATSALARRDAGAGSTTSSVAELRYDLLRQALGVDLDLLDTERHSMDALPVTIVVEALAAIRDPFAGFLEAPAAVVALYQAHSQSIRDAAAIYRETLLAAGRDALTAACPGTCQRVAIEQDLYDAGLPPPTPVEDERDEAGQW